MLAAFILFLGFITRDNFIDAGDSSRERMALLANGVLAIFNLVPAPETPPYFRSHNQSDEPWTFEWIQLRLSLVMASFSFGDRAPAAYRLQANDAYFTFFNGAQDIPRLTPSPD